MSLNTERKHFDAQIEVCRELLNFARPALVPPSFDSPEPAPEALRRGKDSAKAIVGLIHVILFASYEHLLKSVTMTLIDELNLKRLEFNQLSPRFKKLFIGHTIYNLGITPHLNAQINDIERDLESSDSPPRRGRSKENYWNRRIDQLLSCFDTNEISISAEAFPDDGSFFKSSQLKLWCQVMNIDFAAPLARNSLFIDQIVDRRNAISHGRETASYLGQLISINEMEEAIDRWENLWHSFFDHLQAKVNEDDFFEMRE